MALGLHGPRSSPPLPPCHGRRCRLPWPLRLAAAAACHGRASPEHNTGGGGERREPTPAAVGSGTSLHRWSQPGGELHEGEDGGDLIQHGVLPSLATLERPPPAFPLSLAKGVSLH